MEEKTCELCSAPLDKDGKCTNSVCRNYREKKENKKVLKRRK
jgi:hypothetical protein